MYCEDRLQETSSTYPAVESSLSDPYIMTRMLFFVNLVTTGSISSASERMGISVSSGSRWLSDLEKEIGCPLYRRNNKIMPLTDAGEYLFRNFCLIGDKVGKLKKELTHFSTQRRGTIRICCTPVYAEHYLMPVISHYLAGNRHVNFTVNVCAQGIQNWKEYDIIIGAVNSISRPQDGELPLVKRNLMVEPFITVASKEYLLMNGTPQHPSELVNHRCLYANSLTGSNDWAYEINGTCSLVKIPRSLEIGDSNLLRTAVKAGAGIGYLPRYVVTDDLNNNKLVTIFSQWRTSDWLLNIYYPARSQITECVSSFKDYLLEQHKKASMTNAENIH